jgi:hypothetical protein
VLVFRLILVMLIFMISSNKGGIHNPLLDTFPRVEATSVLSSLLHRMDSSDIIIYISLLIMRRSDKSSWNLIVHGGNAEGLEKGLNGFGDTYILSMPSFQWFQVESKNKIQRVGHTCHIIGDRMLVIGGRGVDQPKVRPILTLGGACDTSFFNVLNLNSFEWETDWNPANVGEYKVSEKITSGVGIGGGLVNPNLS